MENFVVLIQVISGLVATFLVLAHEPKSEGLGSIGGSAGAFKGVRTSADDKLDKLTWVFVITFLVASATLGLVLK